jgi:hypothetical protein
MSQNANPGFGDQRESLSGKFVTRPARRHSFLLSANAEEIEQ